MKNVDIDKKKNQKIDVEEYINYRTLTRLTAKELKQFSIDSSQMQKQLHKDLEQKEKELSVDDCKEKQEQDKSKEKTKKSGTSKFAILGCILMGMSAVIHWNQEKTVQELQQNQQAIAEQIADTSQQAKEPKYEIIVGHIEGLDQELADIITRIDELNLSRVEEPVNPEQLEPWMEYVQWNLDNCISEGYVEQSISWAMIKVDLQNYINTKQGLRELVDISMVVTAEESDSEIIERAQNYTLAYFPYTSGVRAYQEGNYVDAISFFEEAADSEHGLAMVRLGQCYQKGIGVSMDLARACVYYVQAVETNQEAVPMVLEEWGIIPESNILDEYPLTFTAAELFGTGVRYHRGHGVEKDERIALKYFKAAATKGYDLAYCYIGCCYMNNIGVGEADYAKAAAHFKLGAQYGETNSYQWLGYCYLYGYGVNTNYEKAIEYLKMAIANGDFQALHWLGVCYEKGLGVEIDKDLGIMYHEEALSMTPENINYEEAIYEGPVYEGPLHGDTLFWQGMMWG